MDQPTHDQPAEDNLPRGNTSEALSPIVSAALEEHAASVLARLNRIAAHCSDRDRYTILGEVGQGGMGRVLRAWDEDLQREVALKEISSLSPGAANEEERAEQERKLAAFVDEARVTSQLDHPGIVPIHEIAVDGQGSVYFTMPLVRGRTLSDVFHLLRDGDEQWNLPRAVGVLLKVCEAAAFAHSKGVIHRDLKPDNIMVGRFGKVYVMDWGLALVMGRRERPRVVGTPAYMAPEQAGYTNEDVGPRSDVYSLGAMLYEMLSGAMPHSLTMEEARRSGSLRDVLATAPRPLETIAPQAPSELIAVCEKAMESRPAERYDGAEALAQDLRAWLEGRVVRAFESGLMAELRKWRTRNRGLSRSLIALALLTVVSGAVVFWQQDRRVREVSARHNLAVRRGYVASLRQVELALRMGEVAEARRALEDCPTELRGFEYEHLRLRANASLATLHPIPGHTLSRLALQPGGSILAVGASDGSLALLDLLDGTTRTPRGSEAMASGALCFSPDGSQLITAGQGDSLVLWDSQTLKAQATFNGTGAGVLAVEQSPDGAWLGVLDRRGRVFLYATEEHGLVREVDVAPNRVSLMAWMPGGESLVLAAESGEILHWSTTTGESKGTGRWMPDPSCLAIASHGALIALGGENGDVLLVDPVDMSRLGRLEGGGSAATAADFSSDGAYLVVGMASGAIHPWEVATARALPPLLGHTDGVTGLAFEEGSQQLASCSQDGSLRRWRLDSGALEELTLHTREVKDIAFATDGRLWSAGWDSTIRASDPEHGTQVTRLVAPGVVDAIALLEGPGLLAYASNESIVRLFDCEAQHELAPLVGHREAVLSLVSIGSGDRLASRSLDGSVRVWDVASGETLAMVEGLDDLAQVLAVSPDGTRLATGEQDGRVRLWRSSDGAEIATLQHDAEAIGALAFAPDGETLAAGSWNALVHLWSVAQGEHLRTLTGHEEKITALVFHPTENRLATGSADRTIRIWDPASGDMLATLRGHRRGISCLAINTAGDTLASGSNDFSLRLWRTRQEGAINPR